eukprot:5395141-Amphidinium_carterae.1
MERSNKTETYRHTVSPGKDMGHGGAGNPSEPKYSYDPVSRGVATNVARVQGVIEAKLNGGAGHGRGMHHMRLQVQAKVPF